MEKENQRWTKSWSRETENRDQKLEVKPEPREPYRRILDEGKQATCKAVWIVSRPLDNQAILAEAIPEINT